MGDQRGQPSQVQGRGFVPIALRPDFSFFGEMTKLANELRPAQGHVNPQQVQMGVEAYEKACWLLPLVTFISSLPAHYSPCVR
jgi:hypothetical protein